MEESFLVDFLKKLSIGELKKLEKEVRTNTMKCIDNERKTNEKLDKRLYKVEMDTFRDVVKYEYFEYGSKMVSKLSKLIWLYSTLIDIDKKIGRLEDLYLTISDFKDLNLGFGDFKEVREEKDMRIDDRIDDGRYDRRYNRRDDRRYNGRDDRRRDEFDEV